MYGITWANELITFGALAGITSVALTSLLGQVCIYIMIRPYMYVCEGVCMCTLCVDGITWANELITLGALAGITSVALTSLLGQVCPYTLMI